MSSSSDKIKGYANEVAGSVKKTVGNAVGSDKMQVEGEVQKLKGKAQVATGDAKDAVKNASTKINDEINRKL